MLSPRSFTSLSPSSKLQGAGSTCQALGGRHREEGLCGTRTCAQKAQLMTRGWEVLQVAACLAGHSHGNSKPPHGLCRRASSSALHPLP